MRTFLFIAFIAFTFLSCEFEIDETVFTEVKKPNTEDLKTIVFADSLDSVYVYEKTKIVFENDLKDLNLYHIFLIIDDEEYDVKRHKGELSFEIDPSEFLNGSHTAVLVAYTSTGSNSLANKVGAEYFELSKQFQVYIDKIPPKSISIDSIYVADGTLNIEWENPEKSNYQKLRIRSRVYRKCNEPECDFYPDDILEKDLDRNTETFQDFDYPGMKIAYSVDIIGEDYVVEGPARDFEVDLVKLSAEYKDEGKIYVKWDSLLLYNNNINIRLNDTYITRHSSLTLSESGEYEDDYKIRIGSFDFFYFEYSVGVDNIYYGYNSRFFYEFLFFPGERFPSFRELKYSSQNEKMYILKKGDSKIYKYDFKTLAIEDSSNFVVDEWYEDEQLFVLDDGSTLYYKDRESIFKVDPNTLNVLKAIDLRYIINESGYNINSVSISNNQLLSFEMNGIQYIVNLQNETLISKKPTISGFRSTINKEGSLYVYRDSLYSIQEENLELRGPIFNSSSHPAGLDQLDVIGFSTNGNELYYYLNEENYIYVFDLNLLQVVRSFPAKSKWTYDEISDVFFTASPDEYEGFDGKMKLFDLNGNSIQSFDTYNNHYSNIDYLLKGNRIFSYRGQVYEF